MYQMGLGRTMHEREREREREPYIFCEDLKDRKSDLDLEWEDSIFNLRWMWFYESKWE